MTSEVHRSRKAARRTGAQAIPWVVLGVVVAVLLLLAFRGPDQLLAMFSGSPPAASGPLNLLLIHSNDTWGYVRPCG
ncbi:MAG: hypothetical protein QME94_11735 [Anaerolineae bacterium]|nr:hypothetical protein [Anaerolineae bacterium]